MFEEVIRSIFAAWRDGSKLTRLVLSLAFVAAALSITSVSLGDFGFVTKEWSRPIAIAFAAIAGTIVFIVLAGKSVNEQLKTEQKIERAEQRAEQHPQEPRAAWDLARVKLEQYVDRNLNQVRSIFWLAILVMGVGFTLIGYGVVKVFSDSQAFEASIVAAVSGILVNFIGATFLLIYRSTMQQAKDYVSVLERINAVGMSVQVLEQIDDSDPKLKNQATADVAKQLLALYQTAGSL